MCPRFKCTCMYIHLCSISEDSTPKLHIPLQNIHGVNAIKQAWSGGQKITQHFYLKCFDTICLAIHYFQAFKSRFEKSFL